MDPTTALAVAGTALQFTETAFKIARFLYIYFTDVKKAPEQAEKLHEEITMMVGIVASLKITLETYPSRIPASQEEALKTAINGSVKIMEELLIKLEDHSEITHATGIRKAKWPLKKREIEGICKEMEKHKRTLSFALAVERLHADRHIDEIVSKSLSHHLTKETEEILEWLCPLALNPFDDHENRQMIRMRSTAEWIFQNETFDKWKTEPGSFLWLQGQIGGGKSLLASSVINKLQSEQRCGSSIGVAFFYCDGQYPDKQDARYIFGSLLRQLLERSLNEGNPHVQQLKSLRSTFCQGPKGLVLDSFIFSLESVSNVYDQVYVIVDGLDECEKRKPLLDSLLKLLGKTINVFMTSRPEVDIKKRFRGISTLEMDKEHMQRDIATYVEWKLEHDESFKYFPLDLKSEIAQKLISKSNGMFRWIESQLIDLQGQLRAADVRKALENLPSSLPDTYSRALEKIKKVPGRWEVARKMLLWLICCKRPMTLQELAFAIAIDPEDKQLDKNKVFFRDDLLLDICGSLVKVRETRQWKKVVEFSHFSVLEYLTTKLPSGLSHEFFIDQKAGHAEIMKCCLAYISFPQLMRRYHNIDHNRPQQVEFYLHDEELLTRERCVEHEFNFMKYASQYWYFHAKEVEHDSTARQAIRDFIENAQHDVFEAWSMVWRRELINTMGAPIHFPISHPARDGLSYAAFLGLHHVVGDLLKEDTLGNSIRYSRNAAMVAAVHDMSSKSLGQLIEAGVNIEHRDEKGLVVLLYAVSVGNVKAVEMLLRANADITARDIHGYFYTYGKGYTALHIAAQYGRTEVCKLLLDNGASVRDLDDADGTPLFAAVCRGLWSRPNVVRVLLKAGSSIRHFNMNGETVLDVAIQAGDTEVINILVEAGATVTATDNMTGFSVD